MTAATRSLISVEFLQVELQSAMGLTALPSSAQACDGSHLASLNLKIDRVQGEAIGLSRIAHGYPVTAERFSHYQFDNQTGVSAYKTISPRIAAL
jgi:hypothetical protein